MLAAFDGQGKDDFVDVNRSSPDDVARATLVASRWRALALGVLPAAGLGPSGGSHLSGAGVQRVGPPTDIRA
jgi:hypothetical protein